MFGPGMLGNFEDDPFFRGHFNAMQNMQRSMNGMMGGFGGGLFGAGMLGAHPLSIQQGTSMQPHQLQNTQLSQHRAIAVDPYAGMFGNMNNMMGNMMSQMHSMQSQMQRSAQDPNSHYFSQSSVMSYSNTGNGPPKVYQASTSTRQAPGGVRETRKALRDSEAGVEQMSIGHHIRERGHVVERKRDTRTGEQEENQDLINLDEEEQEAFDREFREKVGAYPRHHGQQSVGGGRSDRHRSRGLPDAHGHYRYERSQPYDTHHRAHQHRTPAAITYPSSANQAAARTSSTNQMSPRSPSSTNEAAAARR